MTVQEFLKKHRQSPEDINIFAYTTRSLEEMRLGLEGGGGSLKMFPTYLGTYSPVFGRRSEKTIVIDAGGTNFRSALCHFDAAGGMVMEHLENRAMPASDRELGAEEFYDGIARNITRLLPHGGDIGFCFSYPVDMDAGLDGMVADTPKELKARGIKGTRVGECTLRAVQKYHPAERKIVILNDAVATLLGGMAQTCGIFPAYIGYIYGTGTNVAYIEDASKIRKLRGCRDLTGKMIVNTECGNYDKFPTGDFDAAVAGETAEPGSQKFEKASGGKYLARLIRISLETAAGEGVMQRPVALPEFGLGEVSDYLKGAKGVFGGAFGCEDDETAAKDIMTALIDRAARMGAVVNGAAAIKSEVPAGKTVAIVAEGTTFYKLYGYRDRFERYLHAILTRKGISYKIIGGEELNLTGALAAAVSGRA